MMKKAVFCVVGAMALLPLSALAQGSTVWSQASYGSGNSNLQWEKVAVAADGTVAACAKENATSDTFLVQAWNPDGSVAFIYRYPDPGHLTDDGALSIVSEGNDFYVVGYTNNGVASGKTQTLLVKLQSNGTLVSASVLDLAPGTTDDESPVALLCDSGIVTIAGNSGDVGYVAKVDGNVVVWQRTIQTALHTVHLSKMTQGSNALLLSGRLDNGNDRSIYTLNPSNGTLFQHVELPIDQDIESINGESLILASDQVSGDRIAYKIDYLGGGVTNSYTFANAFYNGGQIAQGPDQSAFVIAQDSLAGQLLIWKWSYLSNSIVTDVVNNLAGPGRDYILKLDQFDNPVVLGSTQDNSLRVNLAAWSWDKNLQRQWHEQLTGNPNRDELPADFVIDSKQRFYGIGKTTDPLTGDYKAVSWRVATWYQAHPDTDRTILGRHVSGGLEALSLTDNVNYVTCRFVVPNQSVHPINVEFETELPSNNVVPGATTLTLFVTLKSNTTGVGASVELYDWSANAWDNEVLAPLTPIPSHVQVSSSGDLDRYFQPLTRRLKTRTRIKQFGPTATFIYCGLIDEVRWETYPE